MTSPFTWAWPAASPQWSHATTSAADPFYPASGVQAGDVIYCWVTSKATSGTGDPPAITVPSGWTEQFSFVGGTGTAAVDTGRSRITLLKRTALADGTENGVVLTDLIANPAGGSFVFAGLFGLRDGVAGTPDLAWAGGEDTTAGTAFSVTTTTDPGLTTDDLVLAIAAFDDASGSSASAESVSAAGAVVGTVTERHDFSTSSGNAGRAVLWTASVTSGTSSGAPTVAATSASATVTGPAVVVRFRGAGPTAKTLTDSGQASDGLANDQPTAAKTLTDTGAAADTLQAVSVGLPAPIPGVSPETQELSGPLIDGNGNLYAVTETDVAGGSRARMMRSTNGGRTWAEVDTANRPDGNDLEAQHLTLRGTVLHSVIQRSGGDVHYATFNTSDAAAQPDTWQIDEAFLFTGNTALVQGAVGVPLTGSTDVWAFWHDDAGARYAKRSGGTWSGVSTITGATRGLVGVRGANDLVHLFYNDAANNIQHRSLTAAGTLSAAEQVNDTAGHTVYKNLSNPVYYDDAGAETITVAWGNSSGHLRAARVVNDGTPTAEETVNSTVAQTNPGYGNEVLMATLAVDAATKTVYMVWVDDATQDVWEQHSAAGAAWTSAVELADGVTADWIHGANVYTHVAGNGGAKVLAFAYNNNTTATEFNEGITYDEVALTVGTAKTLADSGVAADLLAAAAAVQLADTGAAAEQMAGAGQSSLTLADTAAASDLLRPAAAVPIRDSGTATNTLTLIGPAGTPDAIVGQANLSGFVTQLWDNPENPDSDFLTVTDPAEMTDLLVSFPTPTVAPSVGGPVQFQVWLKRATGPAADPTVTLELWENGGLVRPLVSAKVASTSGQLVTATFDPADLTDPTGAGVELRIRSRTELPRAGPEPYPAANYPPATTDKLTGTQTTQYRPNALSDRRFDLTGAVWNTSPTALLYPIIIDDGGANTPNGHNTVLKGARINGTLDLAVSRDDQYAIYHSGIEHNCDSPTGYTYAERIVVDRLADGYRFKGEGTAYLKASRVGHVIDDFIEIEEQVGDVYLYDVLCEGCTAGISDKQGGDPRLPGATLTIDGLLLWLKPTVDTPQSQGGTNCSGAGCAELNTQWADGYYRSTFALWKGDVDSRNTIVVRNSLFRVDRLSTYGTSVMAWPGAGLTWGSGVSATYENVTLLWTGMNTSFQPTTTAYPGPALPSGVSLISGPEALYRWDAAVEEWKQAHADLL